MIAVSIPVNLKRYLSAWLEHLSHDEKLDLIMLLSESLKSSSPVEPSKISNLYGAWADSEPAEKLIDDLHKARTFNRIRETF